MIYQNIFVTKSLTKTETKKAAPLWQNERGGCWEVGLALS